MKRYKNPTGLPGKFINKCSTAFKIIFNYLFRGGSIYRTYGGHLKPGIWVNIRNENHRIGAPAFKNKYSALWYKNDKLHRVDGAAVTNLEVLFRRWCINGKPLARVNYRYMKIT